MIKYEWRTELDEAELAELTDLLQRSASYDAEPEYTTISISDVTTSIAKADVSTHHLLIWMLPYANRIGEPDQPERIAGLLRLITSPDGTARAAIVIDPRFRSIGVTTLLLEKMGLDCASSDGWAGTGAHAITAWAQGNHPAAGRLSNRFLIPRTRRVWKLIRSAESGFAAAAAPVLKPATVELIADHAWMNELSAPGTYALRDDGRVLAAGTLDLKPIPAEEFGACATITEYTTAAATSTRGRRDLLDGLAAIAHDKGLKGVIIHVDSNDSDWVNSCRLTGFQHDRTDVRFQIGERR